MKKFVVHEYQGLITLMLLCMVYRAWHTRFECRKLLHLLYERHSLVRHASNYIFTKWDIQRFIAYG